jgi:hypothetical protein
VNADAVVVERSATRVARFEPVGPPPEPLLVFYMNVTVLWERFQVARKSLLNGE